jgi:hypothetical protein
MFFALLLLLSLVASAPPFDALVAAQENKDNLASVSALNCSTIEGVTGGIQGLELFYQCENSRP